MRILCISDQVEEQFYGPNLEENAAGVEAVISCGDLPFEYLEYIVTFLGAPVYYVLGNHDPAPDSKDFPGGCIPLDGEILEIGGVVFAGLSGSRFYSGGPNQYTERQMRRRALALSMKIRWRKLLGKPVPQVFVAHSPPFGIGDREDPAHVGFESFLGLMDHHKPESWLHGHVHLYGPNQGQQRNHKHGKTKVINVFGHRFLDV